MGAKHMPTTQKSLKAEEHCWAPLSPIADPEKGEGHEMHTPPPRGPMASRRRFLCAITVLQVCVCTFLSIRIVPPAHIGVSVTFGSVGAPLQSGLHLCNPFATVSTFNLKTQLVYTENVVPTKEGLNVELDVAVLYHIKTDRARDIFLTLGEKYETVLILPELQSAVRGLTSEVSAKALYTSGRLEIRNKLMDELKEKLGPRGIILEDCLLKGIKLPKQLTDAIELKAQAEQASARMEFVLSKEKQEAERKKVEASGISAFQKIVSEGISQQLLQWKGIEATEKLANSKNAKIVVMGNSKSSLPVILSTNDGESQGQAQDSASDDTSQASSSGGSATNAAAANAEP